jgi:UDP-N-acetylglucosamine 2-epimerase (non-hydrolysing)
MVKNLVFVVGTRPNFVKAAPLWHEASDKDWCRPILVHTGQHYDASLSSKLWRDLELPDPSEDLGVGPGDQSWQLGEIQRRLMATLPRLKPDGVIVFGDVNSTLAAAQAARSLELPLAHVEAGLRSFDSRMVEEKNRIAVDAISDLLFTTEPKAIENLRLEGISMNRVHAVGNLMVDCLRNLLPRAQQLQKRLHDRYGLKLNGYAILTIHRAENVDDINGLRQFMETISEIASELPIVFPAHPRTVKRLTNAWYGNRPSGLILTEPLPYLDFLALVSASRVVLTDSGGIQEETSVLGIPCLTLRENTERPITLLRGTNQLIGFDGDKARAALERLLVSQPPAGPRVLSPVPDEWDGRAASRIMQVLKYAW